MTSKTLTAAAGPPPAAEELPSELAEPYRRLLRVLRASKEMFALVPVESLLSRRSNDRLLECLGRDLKRDHLELRLADVFYQDWDPLEAIERAWQDVEEGTAVVVLRGLERTPPAPLGLTRAQRPSAFARLNQVREHIEKRFPAPLVVWCEPESFGALQRYAPDFFDHFTGLVRFGTQAVAAANEVREPAAEYRADLGSERLPFETGGSRSALRFYEAQLEKSAEGTPERVRALLGLAESLIGLSGSEAPAAAERILEATRQALESLSTEEEPQEWARAQYLRGAGYKAAGELEDARASFERALEIRRRLAVAEPAAFEPVVAGTLNNLGIVLRGLGDRDAARGAYEEALEIRRRLAEHHPAAFEPDVATTLNNLGTVLAHLDDCDAARGAFEEALEIFRRLAEQHPAAFEPSVAGTLNNLGNVLRELGDRDAASGALEEALEIFQPLSEKWPAAFGERFVGTLRRYVAVAPEDEEDPWRRRWQELQATPDAGRPGGESSKT